MNSVVDGSLAVFGQGQGYYYLTTFNCINLGSVVRLQRSLICLTLKNNFNDLQLNIINYSERNVELLMD